MKIVMAFVGAAVLAIASPAAAEEGTVIRSGELKAMPFIDAATSAKVAANQDVTIVGRKGGWVQVQVNGQTGWMRMLNVRLKAGSRPAPGQANVRAASLLRTNSSGKTVTTGIKGLGEEDLQNAAPDPAQVAELASLAVTADEARANALASGLVEQQVDYLGQKKGKRKK
jgi:hypothetical protein